MNKDVRLIKIAEYSGFCPGVDHAVLKMEELLHSGRDVYYRHATVHNESVMARLKSLGLREYAPSVNADGAVFVVSAHGASKQEFAQMSQAGFEVVDTTCCLVQKFQRLVVTHRDQGYQILIFGSRTHQEIRGVLGQIDEDAIVFATAKGAKSAYVAERAALFSQTTLNRQDFEEVAGIIRKKNPGVKVIDTICPTVERRVSAACKVAEEVELMIVIGSPTSSNSMRLFESVSKLTHSILIESGERINSEGLQGVKTIGITAGASTSIETITKVVQALMPA